MMIFSSGAKNIKAWWIENCSEEIRESVIIIKLIDASADPDPFLIAAMIASPLICILTALSLYRSGKSEFLIDGYLLLEDKLG